MAAHAWVKRKAKLVSCPKSVGNFLSKHAFMPLSI